LTLSFVAAGPPDIGRLMRLEVEASLPRGSKAWLEAPPLYADSVLPQKRGGSVLWLTLNPHGRTTLPETLFLSASKPRLRLLVHIPGSGSKNGYRVFVRQLFENEEIGRI